MGSTQRVFTELLAANVSVQPCRLDSPIRLVDPDRPLHPIATGSAEDTIETASATRGPRGSVTIPAGGSARGVIVVTGGQLCQELGSATVERPQAALAVGAGTVPVATVPATRPLATCGDEIRPPHGWPTTGSGSPWARPAGYRNDQWKPIASDPPSSLTVGATCWGASGQWEDPAVPVAAWPDWMHERRRLAPDGPTGRAPRAAAGGSRYGFATLERETAAVRTAPIGGRNERLNRAAWSLGMLVGGGELEDDVAQTELHAAALATGLDDPEATATIRSDLDAGRQKRRRQPR